MSGDFESALFWLRAGLKVRRKGWLPQKYIQAESDRVDLITTFGLSTFAHRDLFATDWETVK